MKVLDGDGQSRSRVELHLHLVGEARDDLQGIITRERNSGGLEFRTRASKVLDPKREMVERGPYRSLGGCPWPRIRKMPGSFKSSSEPLVTTCAPKRSTQIFLWAAGSRTITWMWPAETPAALGAGSCAGTGSAEMRTPITRNTERQVRQRVAC